VKTKSTRFGKNRIDLIITIANSSSRISVPVLSDGSVVLSPRLTQKLGLKPGDVFTLDPAASRQLPLDDMA
jgi:hypothetical protein